ncbi:Monothiol glutaredoxin-5, mitochondrial [Daldinia childiae]|uniref:Monothiol glutaredoxin-5, mitochondrial n=1 Tax=Daldinia childiae TaxID=326645 RepID=UPI001444D779|nr:Monothiol glutaredoxin-5, mitochondrial [Daldinia childiae]KAF3058611.1 Monothiol glutaredoxin-5, mitochondrial [Daldinia childiae]
MFSRPLFSATLRQAARPIARPVICSRPTPFLTTFQQRLLSDHTRQAIQKAVSSAPVVLFMKDPRFTRRRSQPNKFAAFNVLEDQELRSGIKEFSDWPTIPQLYIDKEFVGGCDILVSMHQDGSLAKMLEEKGVLAPLDGTSESKE